MFLMFNSIYYQDSSCVSEPVDGTTTILVLIQSRKKEEKKMKHKDQI